MGWVASREHFLLPFTTPQTHTLPSADTKATEATNNKQRLCLRHYILVPYLVRLFQKVCMYIVSDQGSWAGYRKYCSELHSRSGLRFFIRFQEDALIGPTSS
jgi:hypothetical protein